MILLVEDNPDDEMLTLRAFRKNQITHQVIVARTGEEALELLFNASTSAGSDSAMEPRLVLLDLNLPKIDGHEVLRQIRLDERTKLLPVVVLTSSNEDDDIITSYTAGANGYICKPVGLEEFVDAVRVLAPFWLALNVVPSRRHGNSHGQP
jgi:two-component system, response regulator